MVARYRPPSKTKTDGAYTAFDGTVCRANRATTFTKASVAKLKAPAEGQVEFFQKLERGLSLVLRLSYGGTKAWRVVYYVNGRARVKTIGRYPTLDVAAARKAAYAFDPKKADAAAAAGSFRAVAEDWLKRYVAKKGLRSRPEIERTLKYYVYPRWAALPFYEVRRKKVVELLDAVEDKHGAPMADSVLATVRSICNWYATRDENYSTPIVKGMRRDHRRPEERRRKRILSDDELHAVWRAADAAGSFGAIVKLCLLTAQRREKVAEMRWGDVTDGVWDIQTEANEKGNGGRLKLVGAALDILEDQPEIDDNPYVFAGSLRGRRHKSAAANGPPHFNAWSQAKAALDARVLDLLQETATARKDDALAGYVERIRRLRKQAKAKDEKVAAEARQRLRKEWWVVHDLRRTARSLLPRTGVTEDIAEHLIGHAIPGVRGVYNRYEYFDEKADALAKLEILTDQIVNPPDRANVVGLREQG
jgi:integrase